jgi:hypothetical protein
MQPQAKPSANKFAFGLVFATGCGDFLLIFNYKIAKYIYPEFRNKVHRYYYIKKREKRRMLCS